MHELYVIFGLHAELFALWSTREHELTSEANHHMKVKRNADQGLFENGVFKQKFEDSARSAMRHERCGEEEGWDLTIGHD